MCVVCLFVCFFPPEIIDAINLRHKICSISTGWLVPSYVTPPSEKEGVLILRVCEV